MSAIRILPDRVANQIAAGEVVERPASVVKELVENALDAGATRIEVEYRHGGRSLIRVEDNGGGMSRDDALLCLERHATSKIREAADLHHVLSFGFRGEALPSIASVSRFTLQTRRPDQESGTEIFVNGGRIGHVRDCGMPAGTRVVVAQLFNSVPARRKFLKSDATESAHIIHACRLYALACPQVAFTLREDQQIIFQSPTCTSLTERVREVFGERTAEGLLELGAAEGDLRLHGLISRPGITRATRHEMITFVNRRPVESRTLAYAVLESYHTLIPKGRYPVAFLFLDLDPAGVDVNVHPAKREVRFRDEPRVRGFTIRAVLATVRSATAPVRPPAPAPMAVAPTAGGPGLAAPAAATAGPAGVVGPSAISPTRDTAPPHVGGAIPAGAPSAPAGEPARAPAMAKPPTASAAVAGADARPRPASGTGGEVAGWRHVGEIAQGYSLFEATDGLVVLDRRAAAERVWYERVRRELAGGRVGSQQLLLPVPVELDPIAAAALRERLPFLREHGLVVEPFGRDFFRVEAVPVWLAPEQADAWVRDVMALVRAGRLGGSDMSSARDELARTAAGRAAAGAAGALPAAALDALVNELLHCETPHTSPAGRPTFIIISAGELARRFHKTPAPGTADADL